MIGARLLPLFVSHANGAHFNCVDDITYTDFCLGDTCAMFGHSPAPLVTAIANQANNGLTTMLA